MKLRRSGWTVFRLLAVLVSLALVAAACGDDDGDTTGTTSPTTSPDGGDNGDGDTPDDLDPDGVLRLPTDLTATANSAIFDMPSMTTPATVQHLLITGTLLQEQLDGSFEPDLAVRADVTSPTSIEVELREGLVFTDGSTLDAEVAAWNILRNRDEGVGGAMADELRQVSDVTVDDDLTFTINFTDPVVGTFYNMLSRGETMMFSKEAVESGADMQLSPVAAGPYMIESLAYEDKLVLVKNPDYWNADSVRIPTVEFIHVNSAVDANATVNALRQNRVDIAPGQMSNTQIEALSDTDMEFDVKVTPSVLFWGQMCKGGPKLKVPALESIEVRQALNYAIDRDRLNETIYDGASEPQWGFWPDGHRNHNPELTGYYEQDVAKAKQLLADAGYPDGFTMDAVIPGSGTPQETFTLLIKEDFAEIGVTLDIVTSTAFVQEFFIENRYAVNFFPLGRSGLDKVTRNLTGESIGNICQYENEALNEQIAIIKGVAADSDEARDAWWELEKVALEDAVNIFGIFGTDTTGYYPDRVGDLQFIPSFQGLRVPDVANAYVKVS